MYTELHWIEGRWPGRLAISARPRGGDWLDDELTSWRKSGVDEVVSLLTREEVESLELQNEAAYSGDAGLQFLSYRRPMGSRFQEGRLAIHGGY